MGILNNLHFLLHTVRYLKPVQVYGRLWHILYRPRPPVLPTPAIRTPEHPLITFIDKGKHFFSPNRLRFLNQERDILETNDWNNPAIDKLWLYNLHYFDYLNEEDGEGKAAIGRHFTTKWIRDNPPFSGIGWESYPLSLRIVNWIKWVLAGSEPAGEFMDSLYLQSWYLRRRLEHHLPGNHLLANAKALIFAGLFFKSPDSHEWLKTGLRILTRETEEQILADGGHFERSPMYHSIILEDFLDIVNMLRAYASVDKEEKTKDTLGLKIGQMRFWLKAMCHPDNQISFFNDAAFAIAPDPAKIEAYALRLGFQAVDNPRDGLTVLSNSGYVRMQRKETVLIADVGAIGPDHVFGHAHADTLSFEMSFKGKRVFVNCGTSCYGMGEERLYQRGTAAHNTLVIDEKDSSEVWGNFRVARRAYPVAIKTEEENRLRLSCGHDGYRRLKGKPFHEREWCLKDTSLEITDNIRGIYSKAAAYYHLHPNFHADPQKKTLYMDGLNLTYETDADIFIEKGSYHPEFGRTIPNQCLILRLTGHTCRMNVTWQ